MKFSEMDTPKCRSEFERAIFVSVEYMRQGKMRIAGHMKDYIHSLMSVRQLPNGRVDLLSVDERARLHANSVVNMMESFGFNSETLDKNRPTDDSGDDGSGTEELQ